MKPICDVVFAFVVAAGKIYTGIYERVNKNVSNQCIDMKNVWKTTNQAANTSIYVFSYLIFLFEICKFANIHHFITEYILHNSDVFVVVCFGFVLVLDFHAV